MSNPNETSKKSLSNFKGDAISGDGIVGGGKGSFTMPTPEEEAAGINNSGFNTTPDGTTGVSDDGVVKIIDDGSVKI